MHGPLNVKNQPTEEVISIMTKIML